MEESLTKEHPNTILMSARVYDKISDRIDAKAWEPMELRGKRDKIQIYEVLGPKQ